MFSLVDRPSRGQRSSLGPRRVKFGLVAGNILSENRRKLAGSGAAPACPVHVLAISLRQRLVSSLLLDVKSVRLGKFGCEMQCWCARLQIVYSFQPAVGLLRQYY